VVILIAGRYFGSPDISSYIYGVILFPIAVGLFLTGRKIEGKLRSNDIDYSLEAFWIKDKVQVVGSL